MPQINFGRAFTVPEQDSARGSGSAEPRYSDVSGAAEAEDETENFPPRVRFGRDRWINIMFVAITLAGGLFWAFYFFNGADLWQAVAGWRRVLLHLRPPGMTATIEPNQAGESLLVPSQAADHSGDPFARSSGFLSLALPDAVGSSGIGAGLPTTALFSSRHSPFVQLGFPVPGGDALTQAFGRAVEELARAGNREANDARVAMPATGNKSRKLTSTKSDNYRTHPEHGGKSITQPTPAAATAVTNSRGH